MGNLFLVFSFSVFGLLLLLTNAIIYLRKKKSVSIKTYNILSIYLLALFCIEFFCNAIGILKPGSNLFITHFTYNLQFILLSLFYYNLFESPKLKKLILVNYVAASACILISYILNPSMFFTFNFFEIISTSLLLITYALIHVYKTINKVQNYFYFSIGLAMYLLFSSIIFLSGNVELVFLQDPYIDIWLFNTLFFIIYQVYIFIEWRNINKSLLNDI